MLRKLAESTVSSRTLSFSGSGLRLKKFLHSSPVYLDTFNIQSEEDFKTKVLQSKKPVIVDFHAKWCGPCKTLGPRLEGVIKCTNGSVDLAKVNVDDLQDLALNYKVEAIPVVCGFKNGEVVDRFVGLVETDIIQNFVEKLMKK